MRQTPRLAALVALATALAVPALSEHLPQPGETTSEVPQLYAFHDVIAPLWHEAWPAKNLAMMRELLPQVEQHVEAIRQAELPGILRDKHEAWEQGVAALAAAAGKMKAALAASQEQGSLDAVEELHSCFEQLVRVIRPVMKELDAYHVVLYDLYHKAMPAKDLARVRSLAADLGTRCRALLAAPVPKRFAAREAPLKQGFGQLCEATAALQAVAPEATATEVEAAVETVHTRYQATEELFHQ